jgi:hypothetical protein
LLALRGQFGSAAQRRSAVPAPEPSRAALAQNDELR